MEDESYAANTLGDKVIVSPEEKILGVSWNFITDHLIFDIQCISNAASSDSTPSKKTVVSVATRFYDPLEILEPFIINPFMGGTQLTMSDPLGGDFAHSATSTSRQYKDIHSHSSCLRSLWTFPYLCVASGHDLL